MGNRPVNQYQAGDICESPPRMWGIVSAVATVVKVGRFIPTYVGNSQKMFPFLYLVGVIPTHVGNRLVDRRIWGRF